MPKSFEQNKKVKKKNIYTRSMLVKLETAEVDQNTKSNYNGNSVLKKQFDNMATKPRKRMQTIFSRQFFLKQQKISMKKFIITKPMPHKTNAGRCGCPSSAKFSHLNYFGKKNRIFFRKKLASFFQKKTFFPKI